MSLGIERKESLLDTKLLSFNITREEIQETSVPFYGMITPEIGCIKLKIFNEGAGKDVKEAFDSLKRTNPEEKNRTWFFARFPPQSRPVFSKILPHALFDLNVFAHHSG